MSSLLKRISVSLKLRLYRKFFVQFRAWHIRRKNCINVLFIIEDLGAWKSESLYSKMLLNPRFNPTLLIGRNHEEDNRIVLREHCRKKEYSFKETDDVEKSYWNNFHPDIIFYQKPYGGQFLNNLKSLFCYVPYAFHNSIEDWAFKTGMLYNAWQVYYENDELAKYYSSQMGRGVMNGYATGIPPMDDLAISKEKLEDPWRGEKDKIRIIYAPHHSINPDNWWHSATFLETGEMMLELAEKYSDRVQWAFKPHPLLRGKLRGLKGKEWTDKYYDRWSNVEWSQFEEGKYLGLFKYSDAMIHDCGSFIEEYMVTGNPVMYLVGDEEAIQAGWNETVKRAFNLHERGISREQIENFITKVINREEDGGREKRTAFFKQYLTSPGCKDSSYNIIDCILSSKSAKRFKAKRNS